MVLRLPVRSFLQHCWRWEGTHLSAHSICEAARNSSQWWGVVSSKGPSTYFLHEQFKTVSWWPKQILGVRIILSGKLAEQPCSHCLWGFSPGTLLCFWKGDYSLKVSFSKAPDIWQFIANFYCLGQWHTDYNKNSKKRQINTSLKL